MFYDKGDQIFLCNLITFDGRPSVEDLLRGFYLIEGIRGI